MSEPSPNTNRELVPWLTFAPLEPDWVRPPSISLPIQLSDRISYRSIPDWVSQDSTSDPYRRELREKLKDGQDTCIAVEYDAAALDRNQIDATKEIFVAHLALWLARPTPLSFEAVIHAEKSGNDWVTRQVISYPAMRPLREYNGQDFRPEDFAQARTLLSAILALPKHSAVNMARSATVRALVERSWELRYLLHWLAMEVLFGPKDGREISFRLSQRMALFLEKEGPKAHALFREIKQSYDWRSKIVHGLRVSKIDDEKRDQLLSQSEELLLRVVLLILNSPTMVEIFNGPDREKFLDGLAFTANRSDG